MMKAANMVSYFISRIGSGSTFKTANTISGSTVLKLKKNGANIRSYIDGIVGISFKTDA